MARVKIAQEGVEYQWVHRVFDHGALTWKETIPIANPRSIDIRDAFLGTATDIRREGDDITAEVPDHLGDDWEFGVFINQIDRSTGRKGMIYIHSAEINAIMAYRRDALPRNWKNKKEQ